MNMKVSFLRISLDNYTQMKISIENRHCVVVLHEEGYTQQEIATRLHMNQSSVSRLLKKHCESDSLRDKARSGRPRVTSSRDDHMIRRHVIKDPFVSSQSIRHNLPQPAPSARTIRRRLQGENHLRCFKPARKPLLTRQQVEKRMKFCKEHENWTIEKWKTVIWSDESLFRQFGHYRYHVRRPVGKRYQLKFCCPTVRQSPSVMVWGAFCHSGLGALSFLPPNTTMRAANYLELLQEKLPLMMAILQCDVFQHDGAPCHQAQLIKQWLMAAHIPTLQWPPNSPDLNPIENLWRVIKSKVAGMHPSSLDELKRCIQHIWDNDFPSSVCMKLVESMPKRIHLVLQSKGAHIKY
jgi:predicted DNA-binding protein (UPF0251 family)